MKEKPTKVNILGKEYSITYLDNAADVDFDKRQAFWGQIDYWTRSIRIYEKDFQFEDLFHNILHEVLHGIAEGLKLKAFQKEKNHEQLDLLALGLTDVLFRNHWIELEEEMPKERK